MAQRHDTDRRRIFVAGAVGGRCHGRGAGRNLPGVVCRCRGTFRLALRQCTRHPSAMAAMKGRRSGQPGLRTIPSEASIPRRRALHAMPVIVFHSDRDHTVQQTNVGTSCSKPGTRAAPRRETLPSREHADWRRVGRPALAPHGSRRRCWAGESKLNLAWCWSPLVGWPREWFVHRWHRPRCFSGNGAVLHGAATPRRCLNARDHPEGRD